MEGQALKFVIVGHVDHGKSTLIGRLLHDTNSLPPDKIKEIKKASKELGKKTEFAYLLDHLKEERQQGVTIDTTQVFFKTEKREYVIIDAPGHVEFVKNMITGASQAEAALLIADVKEGVREQTKRHAYILSMLGLSQVIIIINKMDLVNYEQKHFDEVKKDIDRFLTSINIKVNYYIPISAAKGDNVAKKSKNMKWYKGKTTLESLDYLKSRLSAENKPLVFPVQDVYKIDEKRIVVGRIEAGSIAKGDKIKILPDGNITKVKSIEKFKENIDKAKADESIGVTTEDSLFINRGNVICKPHQEIQLSDEFRANIFWISKKSFNKDRRITLKCATQQISCKVDKIYKRFDSSTLKVIEKNAEKLDNLEVGEVLIKTKKPIAVTRFNDIQELGRFVFIEDDNTCAGGIIT